MKTLGLKLQITSLCSLSDFNAKVVMNKSLKQPIEHTKILNRLQPLQRLQHQITAAYAYI
jgi:hypothetical protein